MWESLTEGCQNQFRQPAGETGTIPNGDDFDVYGVHPAIDACVALSELHAQLSGETLEHAIEVSRTSITTVAILKPQAGREMSDEELRDNQAVIDEWDLQWEIFACWQSAKNGPELIKGLRADLREAGISNIGINFQQ